MMERSRKPPDALLRAIAQDLRPVKPSPRPLPMALGMALPAVLVSAAVLVATGPRHDAEILGPLLTWGASAVQFVLAVALVWIAAHESTPGARLPKEVVYGAAAAALLLVVLVTLQTFSASPASEPVLPVPAWVGEKLREAPWVMGLVCGVGSTAAGGILVVVFSRLFRKSLVIRPMAAGALYGAGAGLAIHAGWRIACPVSAPWHALGAHGAALVATVVLGAWLGGRSAIGKNSKKVST